VVAYDFERAKFDGESTSGGLFNRDSFVRPEGFEGGVADIDSSFKALSRNGNLTTNDSVF
jgi:hypothetical protein